MLYTSAVEVYLVECRKRGLSDGTLKAYEKDFNYFDEVLFSFGVEKSEALISEITQEDVEKYVDSLSKKYKPTSQKRKLGTIKSFFEYMEQGGHILVSPFRKLKAKRINTPTLEAHPRISAQSVDSLLTFCNSKIEQAQEQEELYFSTRDLVILEIFINTGARVSEVCRLTRGDIDLPKKTIRVGGFRRTNERIIPIYSDSLYNALENFLSCGSGKPCAPLFLSKRGSSLSDQSVRIILQNMTKQARINDTVVPSAFRNRLIIHLLSAGLDRHRIAAILGINTLSYLDKFQVFIEPNIHFEAMVFKSYRDRGKTSA